MKLSAYLSFFSERLRGALVGGDDDGSVRRIRDSAIAVIFLGVSCLAQAASIDLGLTQCLVAPDPAARGAAITYTLNYANNSYTNNAVSPSITIPLPATTTYVAGSASTSCSHNGATPGVLTCTPDIPANSNGSVSFQLKTTGTTGATIGTTATIAVAGGDTDSNASNDTANCSATINNGVDLSATVGATASSVPGGSAITWTVNGGNAGPDAASNQIFITTLPGTLSYVNGSGSGWSCSASGQVVTCTRSTSLASGASYPQLSIVTQLAAGVSSGSVVLAGTISSAVSEVNSVDNTSNYSVTVTAGADLSVSLPVLPMTAPNTAINYTLTVKNNGPSDATDGITVTFQLPAGFTAGGSVTPTGTGWNACTWSGQVATCVHPGSFVNGRTETITVASTTPNVSIPTTYNATTDNQATIAGGGGGGGNGPADPVTSNNQVNRSIQVTPSNAVYLSFTKAKSPNPVAIGGEITSLIRVSNGSQGPYAAAVGSVTVTDDLTDAQETYASYSGSWSCSNAVLVANTSHRVTCTNTAPISVGGYLDLTIKTTAQVAGVLTNSALVSHPGNWNGSLTTINASITATAANNSPNLKITKTGTTTSNTMNGGRLELKNTENTLTYSLVVTNQGDSATAPHGAIDATNIVITDVIPGYRSSAPATSYGAITAVLTNTSGTSTAVFACGTAGDTVTCTQTGGVLKKDDYVTVTIPVSRGLNAGNFTNTATAYSTTQGDPDRTDNTASFNIQIDPIADLEMVSKTVSPTSAQAGTDVTYTLTFKNDGPSPSSGVEVKDVFTLGATDPGFTFISATLAGVTGGGSCSGLTAGTNYNSTGTPTLTCSGFSLNNGQQGTVVVKVRPNWKTGTQGATTLSNSARIYSTTTAEDLSAAVGDPGDGVSRATAVNYKTQTLTVTNAGLDLGIVTNDAAPGGPDPLGYNPASGGDNSGNDIAYLVKVNNYGPSLATGVHFTYKMTPPNGKVVKFMGDTSSVGGSYTGAICDNIGSTVTGPASLTVTCTYPTTGNADQLASGANESRYLVFRALTAPDASSYTVNTLATVAANETDSNAANDNAPESTTIKVRADLSLTKTVDRTLVNQNDNVVFTIKVTNSGPGNTTGVTVKDLLPTGLQFVSATATRGSYVNGTGIWAIGALNNAENVVLTLTAKVTATPPGSVVNTAEITASDLPDPDSTPNNHNSSEDDQASATVTVGTVPLGSISGQVFLDKNANGTFDGGDAGISGITLNLSGYSFGANGTDDNGSGDDQTVTATTTTGTNGNYTFNSLLAGKYTVTEPTQPSGTGNGITTVGSNGGTATTTNVLPSVISGIVVNATSGYNATAYNFAELNGMLHGYVYVDANNNGVKDAGETPIAGSVIRLSGKLADGTTDVCTVLSSCDATTDASGAYSFPIQAGTYSLEQLQNTVIKAYADGKETAGIVGGTVDNSGFGNNVGYNKIQNITITNTNLSSNNGDIGGYLFGELKVQADLSLTKTVDRALVNQNDNVVFTIKVTNSGPGNTTGVTVKDLLPTGLQFVSATATRGSYVNVTGIWTIDALNNGENVVLTLTAKVTAAPGNVVNTAEITASDLPDPDSTPNNHNPSEDDQASATVTVGTVMLHGYVYVDANNNGVKDAGETPIAGSVIRLSGKLADGTTDVCTVLSSCDATTDASGAYSFPIQAGTYSLEQLQNTVIKAYTDGKETAGIVGGTVDNSGFGNNVGYNKIQNITITDANLSSNNGDIGGYLFGERSVSTTPSLIPPVVSGYVYLDDSHTRVRGTPVADSRVAGWTVTLTATRSDGSSEVICAVNTDSVGYYHLDNLSCRANYPKWSGGLPTTGTAVSGMVGVTYQAFSLSFANSGAGGITTAPQSGGNAGVVNAATGRIQAIYLNSGDNIVEQNLPLDPSGVVYDAVSRAPVAGALVTLLESGVAVPTACLVSNTNPVTTGVNGYYEFLFQLGGGCTLAPGAHTFVLEVTPPAGYVPGVSTMLPPTAANYVPTIGGVDPIQVQALPPTGAQSTRYYLDMTLTLTGNPATSSSNVVNNHIPIDPVKTGLIYVTKTTPLLNVSRGDLVPYTVTAINSQAMPLGNITVVDHIPPGFRYRSGSATLNGVASEPKVSGRDMNWTGQTFNANEKKVWKMILVVGSGVGDGEYVNQAWAINALTGGLDSNVAGATVRVIPDPNFDCSDIIGKVFDDKNANGYQDQGEPGIANVRLATPRGLLVTTDGDGRFHITCADIPQQDRGSNFVMKLDERTLPSGYRVTTDNPGDVRVTRGKMAKLNFGATVHKVVRLELTAAAFLPGAADLLPEWSAQLQHLPQQLLDRPSVLRIAYRGDAGDTQGAARLDAVAARIRDLWSALKDKDDRGRAHFPLVIETELEGGK